MNLDAVEAPTSMECVVLIHRNVHAPSMRCLSTLVRRWELNSHVPTSTSRTTTDVALRVL